MSQRILVATRKGLFTISGDGATWSISSVDFLGDNVSIAHADPRDGTLYAALDHGHFGVKVHRRRTGGPWEEIAAPTYPPKPDGADDTDMWGKPIPWSTVRIWEFVHGGADEPGVLWCGTIPGGVFRSTDHGITWEINHALWDHPGRKEWFGGGADLPGVHSISVDPRDAKTVRAGVSCGGVWTTRDAGQSWTCTADGMRAAFMPPEQQYKPGIQDPHRVVQCPGAPDHLYAQHHNGIFYSRDGASSWKEAQGVEPSAFGFAVAVHPKDPRTAWFIPGISDERRIPAAGQLVVTRTRDGGETFETLRNGLPHAHAYDIAYRHCLDVDGSGERLAFGTTTGGLWVSGDQGDTWQAVSQNLPPVYCVRFAP